MSFSNKFKCFFIIIFSEFFVYFIFLTVPHHFFFLFLLSFMGGVAFVKYDDWKIFLFLH